MKHDSPSRSGTNNEGGSFLPPPPSPPSRGRGGTARRRWLRGALAVSALGAMGGLLALIRTEYEFDPSLPAGPALRALHPGQYLFVRAVARRIVAPDRPADTSILTPDEAKVAEFVDSYVAAMPPSLRRDVLRLLWFVEQVAPFGSGFARRFTSLSAEQQDTVLAAVCESRIPDLRAGFEAMKSLVMMGYYRDPRTWRILGYEGPFVGRPEGGF
jgi:hypothetical protein